MNRYFIFSFLCLFFLFNSAACLSNRESSQQVAIKVGDRSITAGDIKRIVAITSLENGIPEKVVWESLSGLVERIVDDSLILEHGRASGVVLTDTELESALKDIVKDYPDNSFKEILLIGCIDYHDWKERFREQLLIKKVIKAQTELLGPVSYHDIKSRYQERKEDFWHPSRVKFIHIVTKTKQEAEALVVRIKAGEDMVKLLQENSVNPGFSGDHGVSWNAKDMLPQPLSEVLFSIPVGELSDVIKTPYGFHIIKVLQRELPGRKGLLEVRAEIEKELMNEAIERHYAVWLRELRKKYPVSVNYTLLDTMKRASDEGN